MKRQGPALLALFVALGGSAYATGFPAKVIGAKQLKRNAVTQPKIKANAVNGAKIAAGSLAGSDVREASLGKLPSAKEAGSAATATTALDAITATDATTANETPQAGDASALGSSLPTAYHRRVLGSCPGGMTSLLGFFGTPSCGSLVLHLNLTLPAGQTFAAGLGLLSMRGACHQGGNTNIEFANSSSGVGSVNWFFTDGSTVSAGSQALAPSETKQFSFAGSRIEGQFISVGGIGVATAKLHVLDLGAGGCEVAGTVASAK